MHVESDAAMTTDLVLGGGVLSRPGVVTERGLILPEGLPFDDWAALGTTLGRIGRSVMWWLGDWLRYGERTYGEKYAQAINLTGYDYGTLANAVYVAGRVELSRRRESLSFGHHQAVAALSPAQQERWLDAAAPEPGGDSTRMTVRELRGVIGANPAQPAPDGKGEGEWWRRGFGAIIALAQQGRDGTRDPASAVNLIVVETMRIRERCSKTPAFGGTA